MTYNRPRYARRAIAFHERRNQRALVIDGSDNSALSLREQLELQSVQYFHAREPFQKRLAMAGSLIETQFVVLQGDDDFHLTDGLESCCDVLRQNPEYSSACGIPLFQRRLDNGTWHVFHGLVEGLHLTGTTPRSSTRVRLNAFGATFPPIVRRRCTE